MNITLLVTLGAPVVIVLSIIYLDKFKEPTDLILKTFFIGILLCIPAGLLNDLLIDTNEQSYRAGLIEESLKFLVLYFYIRTKIAFDEPMDAIVYGTIISLGFATLENFSYVYYLSSEADSLNVAIARSMSAIPLHATCGVIMGYFFGLHAFLQSKPALVQSIAIPIGIHAIYNYLVTSQDLLWFYFLFAVMVYARHLHTKIYDLQRENSQQEKKVI